MKAHKFGDNIDTDVIIPGKYLAVTEPGELAKVCMEGADPDFPRKVTPGDVIAAGKNFGSGSSREHAAIAIKALGIQCVIAASFARIFYRNALNIGLPVLESPEAAAGIREGDELEINYEDGQIINRTQGECYPFRPFSDSVKGIIRAGGLSNYIRQKIK